MEKRRRLPKEDPFNIGDKLKDLRNRARWTQDYVAAQLGVKPNTLSNYELGILTPPLEVLQKAAALFEVDIRIFFTTDRLTFNFYGPAATGIGNIENQHVSAKEVRW